MRRVWVFAAVTAMAMARPEMYKEKEDFQFSRSSSDEGTKSGFYGAQRGNMGGNYERAHNMDLLAQHQMGGLVRNVNGELGDGAKQKSGSVFSAANSRGVFGSGHYDLSNLEGRNFQEGTSFSDSQSQSSLSSQNTAGYGTQYSVSNGAYGSHSQNSRYSGSGYHANDNTDQALYSTNMHSADNLQSASQYNDNQAAQNSWSNTQSVNQGHSAHDQATANTHLSGAYGSNDAYGSNVRLVSGSPVRVYIRPGSRVIIPVAAQTFDTSRDAASTFDQNTINTETEALGSNTQQTLYKPTNNAKHYESSYRYRKEWEKHDTSPVTVVPLAVPTVNPYPSNSELYEDTQAHGSERQLQESAHAQNEQSSRHYSGYNVKSGSTGQARYQGTAYSQQSAASDATARESSQVRHQGTAYNQQSAAPDISATSNVAGSGGYTNGAYNNGISSNLNNQVEDFSGKPKSYQSSYSYHKSWERQGDPYIIKPSTNGVYTTADSQASQRLTASSSQGASRYGTHRYGAHYDQARQGYSVNGVDCDENGHIRVARSYNLDQAPYLDLSQQSQNLEDLSQQSQNLHDFGQQSQNMEEFGQQSQDLHDFGQQSQKLEDFGQQSEKLEDFGKQIQNAGQEIQSQWDNLQQGQQAEKFDKLEDLGQHAQSQWDQQSQTDLGQETQNTWTTLDTIQVGRGSKDTEQQLNGMEQTGYNHHGTNIFQSQQNTFEINPSNTKPLYQTDNKENPPTPFFTQHHQSQDKTDLHKEDSEKIVPVEVGHQTNNFWDHSRPNTNQNHQTVVATLLPSDGVHQENLDWQKILHEHNMNVNTGYGYNRQNNYFSHNTGYNYPSNGYTTYEYTHPKFEYTYPYQNRGNDYSVNSYTNTQTHYSHSDQSSHSTSNVQFNPHESSPTSLNNLWDLLDNIEKETTSADSTNSFHSYITNHSNSDSNVTQNLNQHSLNTEINSNEYSNVLKNDTSERTKLENTLIKDENVHLVDVERGDIGPESTPRPQEGVGRGDIGPDDSTRVNSNTLNKPTEIFEIKPSNSKPSKTPEEIETLSLTKENNKTLDNTHRTNTYGSNNVQNNEHDESELRVLSLVDQKQFDKVSTSDTKQQNTDSQYQNSERKEDNFNKQSYDQFGQQTVDKQNIDDQTVDLDQHSKQNKNLGSEHLEDQFQTYNNLQSGNINQQGTNRHEYKQKSDDIQQSGVEQQLETIGNQEKQSFNQVEDSTLPNENLGQENQPIENIGQESEGFHQVNINNFDQHNENKSVGQELQQFENLGQVNEGFHQENIDNFAQHVANKNLGQELQPFENIGQESEGFHQENIHDFGQHDDNKNLGQELLSFGQHDENKNLGQELQPFENIGQESEGFHQENIHDFGQRDDNKNLGQELQQFENLGQVNEGFHQENIDNIGQHAANKNLGQELQPFENIGQESEGFHQENINNFGQHDENKNLGQELQTFENVRQESQGFHQENINDFGQHDDNKNLGQELQSFGQHDENKNLGQELQTFENIGQESDGFHQENIHDFGQRDDNKNLGQELQQFENLGQVNEGFHQENIDNFGQHAANKILGQELQTFENVRQESQGFHQENINDFGQQGNFEQDSLTAFEHQKENYDQPQTEQKFQNDVQQNDKLALQSQIEDLNQQEEKMRNPSENIQQQNQQVETFVPAPTFPKDGKEALDKEPVIESEISTKSTTNIDAPPESVTEKVGFWNKFGSKLSSAKDKVASWFSRS